MIISTWRKYRRRHDDSCTKGIPENLSPKTHVTSRIEQQHPIILNHSLSILFHLHHPIERGRSGIWTVRSRFQIFREWMPLKGTKLEKLRKEILSLNGPGQWSWNGSRRGRKEGRERRVLQGASTRKKNRVKRGEPVQCGKVERSGETWLWNRSKKRVRRHVVATMRKVFSKVRREERRDMRIQGVMFKWKQWSISLEGLEMYKKCVLTEVVLYDGILVMYY